MPTASPKAIRLLAGGRVQPAGAAAAFTVRGDHGDYVAVICPDGTTFCSCPAHGRCSHIASAALLQDAMVDGVAATARRYAVSA